MKNYFKNLNIDKMLTALSVIYIVVPVIIFLMFWTKLWIGLIGSGFIVCGVKKVIKELNENDDTAIIVKKNAVPIVVIFLVVLVYVLFSGIGGIGSQCTDFYVRNPMFYDLNHMEWPLVYNFAPDNKISHIFSGEYLFVYYIAYWLPVSLIVKLFNLPTNVADILLMIYVLIGILLIMFNICKYLKCVKYIALIFLFFSGIDILGGFIRYVTIYLMDNSFDMGTFFDLCNDYWYMLLGLRNFLAGQNQILTYEDIMLSIYNVFNQSVEVYLILSIFMRLKTNKNVAMVVSFIFAYSPWAMIGVMIYLLAGSFRKNQKFVNIFNIYNIFIPMIILLVFGSYYMTSTVTNEQHAIIWFFDNELLLCTILSIIFEWLLYMILIYSKNIKYDYFIFTVLNLLIFDLFSMGDRNLNMRGSMPGVFFLAIYIIQFLIYVGKIKSMKIRKMILICLLCFSFVTPLSNVWYGIQSFRNHTNINNPIKSFENPSLYTEARENEIYFNLAKEQLFSAEYKDSMFYKYIMKR